MPENKKVLIVDDEPDFMENLKNALEARSYQVVTSCSREECQEKMVEEPDVIVLGTLSPAGQAFAVHQWLKGHSRYRDTPIVVLDAPKAERHLRGWKFSEGMQLAAEEYAIKPIEPAELLPRIDNLLEESTRVIKVLVVDDHTMVRDGICSVLTLQKDIDVVGEAVDGQEAIEKATRLIPHVVLMDISMPVMSGLEATKRISRSLPQTRVLILTQYDSEENMFVAKEAGAQGFIPKRAASAELLSGIRAVAAGRYFPAAFAYVSANWKQDAVAQ